MLKDKNLVARAKDWWRYQGSYYGVISMFCLLAAFLIAVTWYGSEKRDLDFAAILIAVSVAVAQKLCEKKKFIQLMLFVLGVIGLLGHYTFLSNIPPFFRSVIGYFSGYIVGIIGVEFLSNLFSKKSKVA